MLFNSFEFLLFFPVVTLLYFLLPHKFRWFLLLVASCFFYMFFKPIYILILGFTIIIDYWAGIVIESATDEKKRKLFLIMSIVANLGVLAVFKYYNFLNDNITGLAQIFNVKNPIPYLHILLPIGLSFHTFQAMSYTIEVFRGNQKAERHFGIYALYVMFYPQLVAGPIERPQNMLHQFHEKHEFDYDNFVIGSRQILWGIFKKVVIADRLAIFITPILGSYERYSGFATVLAMVFFAFQIYCDFSGYSSIALGTARIMGFKLMINFNRPYSSKSITEFWRRWHISLSTWFRDYLYIPLGGNRRGPFRRNFNVFLVFLLSGLWHGANWTFLVWGSLHGAAILFESLTRNIKQQLFTRIPLFFSNFLFKTTTFIYVLIAWVFFRANSMKDSMNILHKMSGVFSELNRALHSKKYLHEYVLKALSPKKIFFGFLLIIFLEIIHFIEKKDPIEILLGRLSRPVRWSIYVVLFFIIFFCGAFQNRQFIYFQF